MAWTLSHLAEPFIVIVTIYTKCENIVSKFFSMRTMTNNKAMMNFDYLRHKRYTVDTFGKTFRHSTSVIFSKLGKVDWHKKKY